ncbi:hypothetical protein B9Z55_027876 [Caenorhabditis nigoni]|uniref:Uncharacterized protein n=1 Tax=Caenorhabditis nigoni TaxID=1611254 RepID=A0A2G5SE83_9PELO|nr:hypothetical protein B9Z55_027876 [Caenorhabditis nigoni]
MYMCSDQTGDFNVEQSRFALRSSFGLLRKSIFQKLCGFEKENIPFIRQWGTARKASRLFQAFKRNTHPHV